VSWQHPLVVLLLGLSAIYNILAVGEAREPKTPAQAANTVIFLATLAVLVVTG
jgi:hypothetical protein